MEILDGIVHLLRTSLLVGSKVGVGEHGHYRLMSEELHRIMRQAGDVDQHLRRGVAVDQCIGNEEGTLLAGQDVHRTEMLIGRTDADDLLSQPRHLRIAAIDTGHEGIRLAGRYHHHTKRIAIHHFLAGLGEGDALACLLLGEDAGVAMATIRLPIVAQVDDLDTL